MGWGGARREWYVAVGHCMEVWVSVGGVRCGKHDNMEKAWMAYLWVCRNQMKIERAEMNPDEARREILLRK